MKRLSYGSVALGTVLLIGCSTPSVGPKAEPPPAPKQQVAEAKLGLEECQHASEVCEQGFGHPCAGLAEPPCYKGGLVRLRKTRDAGSLDEECVRCVATHGKACDDGNQATDEACNLLRRCDQH